MQRMKLIYRVLSIITLLSVFSANLFAQGPPSGTPGGGNGGGGGGNPCPPGLPCPEIPITDHIDILFFIMIAFFGLLKAYQYSRKTSVQS